MIKVKSEVIGYPDDPFVYIECPHCKNCESQPVDQQRHHLQSFSIVSWEEDKEDANEVSVVRCAVCDSEFEVEWDYENENFEEDDD